MRSAAPWQYKPAMRKSRGQLIAEPEDEDTCLCVPDEGPLLTGEEKASVVCGRCERTLLLGVSREGACAAIRDNYGAWPGAKGTAAENRPFPLVIECDCGAMNRIWPVIPL